MSGSLYGDLFLIRAVPGLVCCRLLALAWSAVQRLSSAVGWCRRLSGVSLISADSTQSALRCSTHGTGDPRRVGTWDGPFYVVGCDGFSVSFALDRRERLEDVCNVDVWLTFADGSRWTATVFTLAEIERLMQRWRETGEALAGAYFTCSDGLIVRRGGVDAAIVDVVAGLVATGEFRAVLQPTMDDEGPAPVPSMVARPPAGLRAEGLGISSVGQASALPGGGRPVKAAFCLDLSAGVWQPSW